MKLIPAGALCQSEWEDGLWIGEPGLPSIEGSWIHPPPQGHSVPEFEFEEGHESNRNEPPPVFYVGKGNECHIRIDDDTLPERVCRVYKEHRTWLLEALLSDGAVHLEETALDVGRRVQVIDGAIFSLVPPPTKLAFKILINEDDNWYFDHMTENEFPNKYPGRFPFRTSLSDSPPAPEELRRLAWQTDQMRRRSEEDQVRVSDWAAFSQYVKRYYYKYGIECTPWNTTGRQKPVEPKGANFQPRAYPSWIADVVRRERQQPGIDPRVEMPFESSLRLSGVEVQRMQVSGSVSGTSYTGAGTMPVASASEVASPLACNDSHLRLSFRQWLEEMDESLFLMQYHDSIASNFDSVQQIHEIYFKNGELRPMFFEDVGIKKLGHRRILEKWFKEFCVE